MMLKVSMPISILTQIQQLLSSLFLLMLLLWSEQSQSKQNPQTLIASGHGEYPPFMYRKGNEIVGVGVDITKLIFDQLGIKVEAKYVGSWSRVQRKAKAGTIDLIVGIYKTRERETYLAYPSEPYIAEPVGLFYHHSNKINYTQWADLVGKKGATVLGESFGQEFDNYAIKHLSIQRLSGITQSFRMLERNRLQYSIYALYPGLIKIIDAGMEGQIIVSPNHISTQDAFQAFSKKSQYIKHIDYFSQKVKALKKNGTVDKLINKHMRLLGQNITN